MALPKPLLGFLWATWCVVVWLMAVPASAQMPFPDAARPQSGPPRTQVVPPWPLVPQVPKSLLSPKPAAPVDTRLRVSAIILEGVHDRPELNISVAELTSLVERMRLASENRLGGLARDRYLSMDRLNEVAARVAAYYQDRGLLLATAVLPAQEVLEGKVVIQVLEGRLERVIADGNRHYPSHMLVRPFSQLIGEVLVRGPVERALLTVGDYPGFEVFGVFRPGSEVGGSTLVLKTVRERRWQFVTRVDNHGTEFTGRVRLHLDATLNSPRGVADLLNISIRQGLDPANLTYGAVSYRHPVLGPNTGLTLRGAHNAFDLGGSLAPLGLSGVTNELALEWDYRLQRSRKFNQTVRLNLTHKDAELSEPVGRDDDLTVVGLEWNISHHWLGSGMQLGGLAVYQGLGGILGAMPANGDPNASRIGGSGRPAGGSFLKLTGHYEVLRQLFPAASVLLRAHGQYSGDLLPSLEQFRLGGPDTVRAYPVSEVLRDQGYAASLDILIKLPGKRNHRWLGGKRWGDAFNITLFADAGGGSIHDPLISEVEQVTLSGVGFGLRLATRRVQGQLSVSTPTASAVDGVEDATQTYLSLSVQW